MTVAVLIGNSDNRLTQQQWAAFHEHLDLTIRDLAGEHIDLHFAGASLPTAPYQNACWVFEPKPSKATWNGPGGVREFFVDTLREAAATYGQDSIAWVAGATVMITPDPGSPPGV